MTTKSLSYVAAALLTVAAATGCGGKQSSGNKREQKVEHMAFACDATFQNIMDQEVDVFEYSYENSTRQALVVPYYVSQRAAIDSLLNPDNDIRTIVIARRLNNAEKARLQNQKKKVREQRIAVDAIALIVNNENPQDVISMKELRQILSGEVKTWKEMWPTKLDSIRVVFDQNGSSLVEFMRDSINGGKPFGANIYAEDSPREVFEAVTKRPNAIGIVGVSWISTDMDGTTISKEEMRTRSAESDTTNLGFNPAVKVLAVAGDESLQAYKPYQAYIFDGRYPLFRSIYMTTTTVGGTLNNAFYAFVTGMQGQKVIQLTGVLPGTVQPRMVNVTVDGE
jgi:phosphate transport system substrate-binding protein